MNKVTPILAGAVLLLSAVLPVSAADTDPGIRTQSSTSPGSFYYRPTLRYYGKDYTVAYGFVPWDRRSPRVKPTYTDEHFTLTEAQVSNSGARGPLVIYTQRKATTKITRTTTSTKVSSAQ